jgi:hypothetical protein
VVNPIRAIWHVNNDIGRGIERAVVSVTATVHLSEASQRQQDDGEGGESFAVGSFHACSFSLFWTG